jgi:3-oxoadipate enol-lactonase/4-carboxymuconolactone decarboxylase
MDLRRNLPTITAPTWVLVGEQDPGTSPEHARVIAHAIPGAQLTVLDPGAHILNVERADEVSAAILTAVRDESTQYA